MKEGKFEWKKREGFDALDLFSLLRAQPSAGKRDTFKKPELLEGDDALSVLDEHGVEIAVFTYSMHTIGKKKIMYIGILFTNDRVHGNVTLVKSFLRKLAEILEKESVDIVQWTSENDATLHRLYGTHIPAHKKILSHKYTAKASDIIKHAKRYAQYKTKDERS